MGLYGFCVLRSLGLHAPSPFLSVRQWVAPPACVQGNGGSFNWRSGSPSPFAAPAGAPNGHPPEQNPQQSEQVLHGYWVQVCMDLMPEEADQADTGAPKPDAPSAAAPTGAPSPAAAGPDGSPRGTQSAPSLQPWSG